MTQLEIQNVRTQLLTKEVCDIYSSSATILLSLEPDKLCGVFLTAFTSDGNQNVFGLVEIHVAPNGHQMVFQ